MAFCGGCGVALGRGMGDRSNATPEHRQVAVLFVDLVGYTALTAELGPEDTRTLLDSFFAAVDGVVERHGGSVAQHLGDCVMALFGAPVARGDDVDRAVRAALAMSAAMPALSLQVGRQLAVHVGVAVGDVVAGGTGSDAHRIYTVTGDAVNLASRLEGLTKVYGVFCVVGPQTREDYIDIFALLAGKNHSIPLGEHQLFANQEIKKAVSETYDSYSRPHEEGLAALEATAVFERVQGGGVGEQRGGADLEAHRVGQAHRRELGHRHALGEGPHEHGGGEPWRDGCAGKFQSAGARIRESCWLRFEPRCRPRVLRPHARTERRFRRCSA